MKQFLKTSVLIILIILTFISCNGNEANEEVHEVRDDEEWTEDWDAIAAKEKEPLLSKLPDFKSNPNEFIKEVFMLEGEIGTVSDSVINGFVSEISRNSSLQNLTYDNDPNGFVIARLDQYFDEKLDKQVVFIRRYKSMLEEPELLENNELIDLLDSKFNFANINRNTIQFYHASLVNINKKGKTKIIWENIYTPYDVYYIKEVKVESNYIYTNEAWRYNPNDSFEEQIEKDYAIDSTKAKYVGSFVSNYINTNLSKYTWNPEPESLYSISILELKDSNVDSILISIKDEFIEEAFEKYFKEKFSRLEYKTNVTEILKYEYNNYEYNSKNIEMVRDILDKYVNWTYYNKKPK